jgi:hypothetical protein
MADFASLVDAMTSEHLFNDRTQQQNFPQKKKQKADQSGRHALAGRAAEAAAFGALGAQAGGLTDDTFKQEADSRG